MLINGIQMLLIIIVVMGSPSLEVFKQRPDGHLSDAVYVCIEQRVEQMASKVPSNMF